MAITKQQLLDLGFKPAKRKSPYSKKYDSLILKLNDKDYLYLGYSTLLKTMDFKRIWKSFIDIEGNRCTYQIIHLGDAGYGELKDYIKRYSEVI